MFDIDIADWIEDCVKEGVITEEKLDDCLLADHVAIRFWRDFIEDFIWNEKVEIVRD